jgi:hypothetical protein
LLRNLARVGSQTLNTSNSERARCPLQNPDILSARIWHRLDICPSGVSLFASSPRHGAHPVTTRGFDKKSRPIRNQRGRGQGRRAIHTSILPFIVVACEYAVNRKSVLSQLGLHHSVNLSGPRITPLSAQNICIFLGYQRHGIPETIFPLAFNLSRNRRHVSLPMMSSPR